MVHGACPLMLMYYLTFVSHTRGRRRAPEPCVVGQLHGPGTGFSRWNVMATKGPLYLGVDGGGTRCRARIEDKHGIVLGEGGSGPATMRLGLDKAWRSILARLRGRG